MLKVVVGYPSREEERKIVDRMASGQPIPQVRKVAKPEDILAARVTVDRIWMDEKVRDYLVDVVRATRAPAEFGIAELEGMIEVGASPRASISLMKAAKAHAFLHSRGYVTPHDVKSVALEVLRHRVILTYEAEAEGKSNDDIIRKVLDNVPVP
jgi:MoxR-like ATPase